MDFGYCKLSMLMGLLIPAWRVIDMIRLDLIFSAAGLILLCGCSSHINSPLRTSESVALRPLTADERAADFDALASAVRNNYGPLEYK